MLRRWSCIGVGRPGSRLGRRSQGRCTPTTASPEPGTAPGTRPKTWDRQTLIALCCYHRHNACMTTSITIREVPAEVRDELASRAAKSGRSLQSYLRAELVELASRPDQRELIDRIADRVEITGTRLSAVAIVDYLAEERR